MKRVTKNKALEFIAYSTGVVATLMIMSISCIIAYGLVHQNLNLLASAWLRTASLITVILSLLNMFAFHFYNTYREKDEGDKNDEK